MDSQQSLPSYPTRCSRTDATLGRGRQQRLAAVQAYLEQRALGRRCEPDLEDAWRWFYGTYDEMIRRFARSCRIPATVLDDCVQEVWVAILEKLCEFDYNPARGRFRSWLYKLVRNKVIDIQRAERRRTERQLDKPPSLQQCDGRGNPADAFDRRSRCEVVRRVLKQLESVSSPQSYRVLYLRRIEQLSVSEVAALLGFSPAQVRARQHRMQRKLREALEQSFGATDGR